MRTLTSVLCLAILSACGEPFESMKWGWTPIAGPADAHLWALKGRSSTELWAAGTEGRVFRFNGRSWSLLVSAGARSAGRPDLAIASPRDTFLMSPDEVFRFEGTNIG